MNSLVYPTERKLGALLLVLGTIAWIALLVGTVGIVLIGVLAAFLAYLFAQSALIAHIKGHGVRVTPRQFPDLHEHVEACCAAIGMKTAPEVYVLNGNGALNAFATRFLGSQYVVLLSDVVDAMAAQPEGLRFYIGHELGHLHRKHLSFTLLRLPVAWLPLVGAAYSRAREYTCDLHGRACVEHPETAARALAALLAGAKRWAQVDVAVLRGQTRDAGRFWMAFHELIGAYPWTTKRVSHVMDPDAPVPSRNPLSYVLALFVPFGGRMGSMFSMLITVYVIGVLAAVALPAYQAYQSKAHASAALLQAAPLTQGLAAYYERTGKIPGSLADAGLPDHLADGRAVSLDARTMTLSIDLPPGHLLLRPGARDGRVTWQCLHDEGLKPGQVPASCATAAPAGGD